MDTTAITSGAADPGASSAVATAETTQQAQAPSYAGWDTIVTKGADGIESLNDPAQWLEKTPPAFQKTWKDNMTAARAKHEGMVKRPGADAKPEEWESFHKAIGRPDKPEEYGLVKPENMPEGMEWNDARMEKYAGSFHKRGLTKEMVAGVLEDHNGFLAEEVAAMRAAGDKMVADEREALNKEFGPRLADVAASAQAAATAAGIDPDLFNPGAGKFAGVSTLKLVAAQQAQLAKLTGEANFSTGAGSAVSPTMSGKAYAEAVIGGKHADSDKYYGRNGQKADPEFAKKISAQFQGS